MRLTTKIVVFLLGKTNLPLEDRSFLTTVLMDRLRDLPLHDIMALDDQNNLIVNGKPLDLEKARLLRESAIAALKNSAFTLIRDQVAFVATTLGVHKAETPEQMFFARAALWWGQQEQKHLELLTGKEESAL